MDGGRTRHYAVRAPPLPASPLLVGALRLHRPPGEEAQLDNDWLPSRRWNADLNVEHYDLLIEAAGFAAPGQ
jgi:hypothetical protein